MLPGHSASSSCHHARAKRSAIVAAQMLLQGYISIIRVHIVVVSVGYTEVLLVFYYSRLTVLYVFSLYL